MQAIQALSLVLGLLFLIMGHRVHASHPAYAAADSTGWQVPLIYGWYESTEPEPSAAKLSDWTLSGGAFDQAATAFQNRQSQAPAGRGFPVAVTASAAETPPALPVPAQPRATDTDNAAKRLKAPTPLRFCYENQPLPPFILGQGNVIPAEQPGVIPELMHLLDEHEDQIVVKAFRAPWPRCLALLANGQADAVIGSYREDRARYARYPLRDDALDSDRAILQAASYCLFQSPSSSLRWSASGFRNPRREQILVLTGHAVLKELDGQEMPLLEVDTLERGFRLVELGRAGGLVTNCESGRALAREWNLDKIRAIPVPLHSTPAFMMFSRRFHDARPDLSEALWTRLSELARQNFQAILQRY